MRPKKPPKRSADHYVVDAREEFAQLCLESVRANATYQGYPLGTALARPVIAEAILEVAEEQDCTGIAHGCTGKGNDQLRFEAVWRSSDLEVIAPCVNSDSPASGRGVRRRERPARRGGSGGDWSIDTNIWSRSVEGDDLEDPNYVPPRDIYEWTDEPGSETEEIEITFEQGYPVAIDGEEYEPVELIESPERTRRRLRRRPHRHDGRPHARAEGSRELRAPGRDDAAERSRGPRGARSFTREERQFKNTDRPAVVPEGLRGPDRRAARERARSSFIAEKQTRVTGTVTIRFEGGQARRSLATASSRPTPRNTPPSTPRRSARSNRKTPPASRNTTLPAPPRERGDRRERSRRKSNSRLMEAATKTTSNHDRGERSERRRVRSRRRRRRR